MTAAPCQVRPGSASGETVLVTGATGFLGGALVRRLLDDGVRVRVLVRSPPHARVLAERGAELVVGDITAPEKVGAAADGVTTVYHLAGRLFVPGIPAAEYRRTHIDGTRTLLAACAISPSVRRVVHVSTTGVVGITGDHPADETAPIRPTNIYEATKAEAEAAVREAGRRGCRTVIARPGLVYGPGDLHLLPFYVSILRRRFRPIGTRPVWLHPIFIDDLTDALLVCGAHPDAVGECFNLAGRHPVSLSGLAQAVAHAAGTRPTAGHIPIQAARGLAWLGDQLPAGVRPAAPLTQSRLEFLTHSRVYNVAKAGRILGFTAATDLATGTAETIAWYRREGYLPMAAAA